MADIRVPASATDPVLGVPGIAEERPRPRQDQGEERRRDQDQEPGGREELAVALDEPGRRLRAELEQDGEGELHIRVVDVERGELVALLTPEDLRAMAEATGLPAGLLFQARS